MASFRFRKSPPPAPLKVNGIGKAPAELSTVRPTVPGPELMTRDVVSAATTTGSKVLTLTVGAAAPPLAVMALPPEPLTVTMPLAVGSIVRVPVVVVVDHGPVPLSWMLAVLAPVGVTAMLFALPAVPLTVMAPAPSVMLIVPTPVIVIGVGEPVGPARRR